MKKITVIDLLLILPILLFATLLVLSFGFNQQVLLFQSLITNDLLLLDGLLIAVLLYFRIIWTIHKKQEDSFVLVLGIGLFVTSVVGTASLLANISDLLLFICIGACLLFLLVFMIFQRYPPLKIITAILLTAVISTVVSLLSLLMVLFSGIDTDYTILTHPHGHTIVFAESAFLFSGETTIYQATSPITMTSLGTYTTDDGDKPIQGGTATIVWDDHTMSISAPSIEGVKTFEITHH